MLTLSDLKRFDERSGRATYDLAHAELAREEQADPCTCMRKGKRRIEEAVGPMVGYPSLLEPDDLDPDCELHFPWVREDDRSRMLGMREWMAGYQVGYGTAEASARMLAPVTVTLTRAHLDAIDGLIGWALDESHAAPDPSWLQDVAGVTDEELAAAAVALNEARRAAREEG